MSEACFSRPACCSSSFRRKGITGTVAALPSVFGTPACERQMDRATVRVSASKPFHRKPRISPDLNPVKADSNNGTRRLAYRFHHSQNFLQSVHLASRASRYSARPRREHRIDADPDVNAHGGSPTREQRPCFGRCRNTAPVSQQPGRVSTVAELRATKSQVPRRTFAEYAARLHLSILTDESRERTVVLYLNVTAT
jgi:hypothetical protein